MKTFSIIHTTQFVGKVLVVTFWASWCGPCRAELPILENLQRAAKGSVQVIAEHQGSESNCFPHHNAAPFKLFEAANTTQAQPRIH